MCFSQSHIDLYIYVQGHKLNYFEIIMSKVLRLFAILAWNALYRLPMKNIKVRLARLYAVGNDAVCFVIIQGTRANPQQGSASPSSTP